MRTEPTAVFFHTVGSVPLRMGLAWIIGTLGILGPSFIGHGPVSLAEIGYQFLFFPLILLALAFFSGWWSFLAIPLLAILAWRVRSFLRDEGSTIELYWIFALPFLICLRVSGDAWLVAIGFIVVVSLFVLRQQKRLEIGQS